MIIVKPSVELLWVTPNPLQTIELAGRTAYKSEDKITDESAPTFVKMLMGRHHLSCIEHASMSMKFILDRATSMELIRHRLFSFTQSSTRYCNFSKDKFDNQIRVIQPPELNDITFDIWKKLVKKAEEAYMSMLEHGNSPQIARSILPNCLQTEIIVTGNFREWLHFFKVRTDKAAHPQMREIAFMALEVAKKNVGVIFEDV